MKKRHEQKLVLLAVGLLFVFTVPFIQVLNRGGAIGGVPCFYLFVFVVWAASILISYIVLRRHYE